MTPPYAEPYKRYVLAVLTLVYALSFVDRALVALLLEPIKQDLQLSDTQLGFLTGIAFGLFYATLGLPIARWADRGNRVTITSLAIGLWGLTVMACMFVGNFIQLMCARVAAGVGEAGCMPPTYSLLGDYFSAASERIRAMGLYMLASPMASLFAFIVGGRLNELYGWRMTFLIMSIPALLVALVVKLTVSEPREAAEHARSLQPAAPPMRDVVRALWGQGAVRSMSIGLIVLITMGVGMAPWYAAFLMRSHGMGTAELGTWLGLIFGLGGMSGTIIGGYVASKYFADDARRQLRLSAVTIGALTPLFVLFLLVPHKVAALAVFVPLNLTWCVFYGPTFALMQRLVPAEMRATTVAIVMLFANLIGLGIGPQLVGMLSDLLAPSLGAESLRYSMLTMSSLALVAAYFFWRAGEVVPCESAR